MMDFICPKCGLESMMYSSMYPEGICEFCDKAEDAETDKRVEMELLELLRERIISEYIAEASLK